LEQLFWNIADPDHPSYLKHLSLSQTAEIIGAPEEDVAAARKWLLDMGARASSLRVSALHDTVSAAFPLNPEANGAQLASNLTMLSASRPPCVAFLVRRDARALDAFSVPVPLQGDSSRRQDVAANSAYTITNIKNAYGMPVDLQASNDSTLQMVWGPGTFGYSKLQLMLHKRMQCPLLNMNKVRFDTPNHGRTGGDNFGEGNLDTKMIASFGLNVDTLVSNTNTSASTEEGEGFGQAMLDFVTELAARHSLPHVLSLSLGSLSASSCELLCSEAEKMGHSKTDCEGFLQQQRQVCMYLSEEQTARINVAFQVLGVRGVSVFGSSGDGGSHFSFGKFQGGAMADVLNEISCKYQMPVFPTASPYITSVGGTMWSGSASHPVTWAGFGGGSGGGFSWQFGMPDYQRGAVAAYLNTTSGLPPSGSFNKHGRAFPDISAVGVMGTSQSCPILAGIFSMLIDHRLNAKLPPLGFVATRIWKVAQQFPGKVFQDVPEGNSKTTCDNGFPSKKGGWDPNTGWGRPIWEGMLKHLGSDAAEGEALRLEEYVV